jgi:hypothetical protein
MMRQSAFHFLYSIGKIIGFIISPIDYLDNRVKKGLFKPRAMLQVCHPEEHSDEGSPGNLQPLR